MRLAYLFLLISVTRLIAADFPFEYNAAQLPPDSTPAWFVWKSENSSAVPTLANNVLRVETKANERFAYMVGTYNVDKKAGSGSEAWDASKGGTTVDVRFKCDAGENKNAEVFAISISNGSTSWQVNFSPSKIKAVARVKEIDTTQPDTYRFTLAEGALQVSSAKHGVIFERYEGLPGEKASNRLLFGTMGGKNDPSVPVTWDVNFIRWTNQTAIFTPPAKE